MPDGSSHLHERPEDLSPELIDRHRAIVSLMEELEAVDWYDQRVSAASDPELKAILAHNRDEEKEHAAMALEWLRRRDPALDAQLRAFLFTDRALGHDAAEEGEAGDPDREDDGSLGIGSLRGEGI